MGSSLTYFSLFFTAVPIMLLIGLGAYYRYKGTIDEKADATLFWLVIHFFTPCLIVDSFLGNKALENIVNLIVAPILGFSTVIIGMIIAGLIAYFIRLKDPFSFRPFLTSVSLYNYGYIPIPIILIFFSKEVLGMLLVFNVGLEIALWTIGFIAIVGKLSVVETLKKMCTPPLIAVVVSIFINFIFDKNPLPPSVVRLIHMIGQGTVPLALLVIGATVFDHVPTICSKEGWKPVIWGIFARLLFIPIIFVAMAIFLPIHKDLKIILFIQAGMPSAVLPIIFIKKYGGNLQMALRIVIFTSLISMFTMPLWICLSCK